MWFNFADLSEAFGSFIPESVYPVACGQAVIEGGEREGLI